MEPTIICPVCHNQILASSFFCPNCGKKLKDPPPGVDIWSQLKLFFISIFLVPLGYLKAVKYLRQPDLKSKEIGTAAIVLTTISLIVSIILAVRVYNSVNEQVNKQLQQYDNVGF